MSSQIPNPPRLTQEPGFVRYALAELRQLSATNHPPLRGLAAAMNIREGEQVLFWLMPDDLLAADTIEKLPPQTTDVVLREGPFTELDYAKYRAKFPPLIQG